MIWRVPFVPVAIPLPLVSTEPAAKIHLPPIPRMASFCLTTRLRIFSRAATRIVALQRPATILLPRAWESSS
ncbi:hypothetical protein DFS34DRAFT_366465 [Phlyctochytrium arcticum]|nr:hypothetical protein DFS34DRAFT_366465 [Phlyctochytrium arcticum]